MTEGITPGRLLRWPAIGALLALILFAPALPAAQWANVIANAAHGVVFAMLAPMVCIDLIAAGRAGRRPYVAAYAGALAIAFLFGATTELLQIPLARDASFYDLANDVFGAWLGLTGLALFDRRLTRPAKLGAAIAAAIPAAVLAAPVVSCAAAYVSRDAAFPTLADFHHSNLYFIGGVAARLEVGPLPASWAKSDSEPALHVDFRMARWSGADFREPYPDWRGYRELALDLTNPNDSALDVNLRVHDASHDFSFGDRFNTPLHIESRSRSVVRIPLTSIAQAPRTRAMDLSQIADFMLFVSREEGEHAAGGLYVSRIWLE